MRLQDWPERLGAYIVSHLATPFAWGSHDCVSFANGAHEALTGERIGLPTWFDEAGATLMLDSFGGLIPAVDSTLPRVPLLFAQRGDLVLIEAAGREWLAVCDGEYAWAPAGDKLTRTAMTRATIAWSIGQWQ